MSTNVNHTVSVVMTTYNVSAYVEDTINSLLNQTYADFELIIVDDGSTDNTVNIIQDYALRDSRIVPVILGVNSIGGVATAANAGLNIARGEYILFADGDDLYEKDFIECLYKETSSYDADIGICSYDDFDNLTNEVTSPSDVHVWDNLPKEHFYILGKADRCRLLSLSPVPWRKIYKRKFIEAHNHRFPVVDMFFEDNPFHWAVVMSAETAVIVRKSLCHHRMNRPGQTMASGNIKIYNVIKHFPYLIQAMKLRCEENYRPDLIKWLVGNIYWAASETDKSHYNVLMGIAHGYVGDFSNQEVVQYLESGEIDRHHVLMLSSIKNRHVGAFSRIVMNKKLNIFTKIRLLLPYGEFKNEMKSLVLSRKKIKTLRRRMSNLINNVDARLDVSVQASNRANMINEIIHALHKR